MRENNSPILTNPKVPRGAVGPKWLPMHPMDTTAATEVPLEHSAPYPNKALAPAMGLLKSTWLAQT